MYHKEQKKKKTKLYTWMKFQNLSEYMKNRKLVYDYSFMINFWKKY